MGSILWEPMLLIFTKDIANKCVGTQSIELSDKCEDMKSARATSDMYEYKGARAIRMLGYGILTLDV